MNVIRYEAENSDYLEGFQISHGISGGTGGGLTASTLLGIRDSFPNKIISTFSVYPSSSKGSDVSVEAYNAAFSMQQLIEDCDQTFVIDNDAVYKIACTVLQKQHPTYDDLNWFISQVMANVTHSFRFGVDLNPSMRKMAINMVTFPRLHFLLLSHAPLIAPEDKARFTVQEVSDQLWMDSKNFFANVRYQNGKWLSVSMPYRCQYPADFEDETAKWEMMMSRDLVPWIPDNFKRSLCAIPAKIGSTESRFSMVASMIANTTAIKGVFQRINGEFNELYKHKRFCDRYVDDGMDMTEFDEADKNVKDLMCEYQEKQDVVIDENSLWRSIYDEEE